MNAGRHLRQPVVQFVGNVVPFLFQQSGPFAFADILQHEQAIERLALLIAQRRPREVGPEDFAILSQEAFLHLIAADRACQRLPGQPLAFPDVVWMGNCRDILARQFLFGVGQHLIEGFVDLQDDALQIGEGHADRGRGKNIAETRFALLERHLALLAIRDVI